MNFVSSYIKAGYPCLAIRSTEQERVMDELMLDLKKNDLSGSLTAYTWKCTQGMTPYLSDNPANDQVAYDLVESLKYIKDGTSGETPGDKLYVLFNPKEFLTKNPIAIQALRDAAFAIRLVGSHIIMIGGAMELPEELEDVVTFLDFDLPTKDALKVAFKGITTNYKDLISGEVTDDLLEVAAENACGLTYFKAENAIARSIVEAGGIDVNLLRKEKQLAIKQSGVLEYVPHDENSNTLGGFDTLKGHVGQRIRYFSDHKKAIEFGLRPPKGIMLVGLPGCLDAGTKLRIRRGKRVGGREYTVEETYNKFNGIPHPKSKGWNRKTPTFTQSLCDGVIRFHEIDEIVCSGVKERFEVVTDMGRKICVTAKHPFKVPDGTPGADSEGYIPLHDLKPGDMVICKGTWEDDVTYGGRQTTSRKVQHSIPFHPNGSRHFIAGKDYKRLNYARLVVEASNNNMPVEEFIRILKEDEDTAKTLNYLAPEMSVHHIDGDASNDSLDNLLVVPKGEHEKIHGVEGASRYVNRGMQPVVDHIKSIESIGYAQTYDIVMKAPYHNYVADGFVVHNTGKSLASKAIASSLGLPLYRFNVGSLFKGIVGASEAATRQALKLIDSVAPCCLVLDEMEKLVAGLESSGKSDSGVTSRVIGSLLTWMQETTAPIYKVATCNTIRNLDAALFRRGRWDAVFAVDLPTTLERVQIFSIHLLKRKRNPQGFDLTKLADLSDGFVGAEIESAVEESLYRAFDAGRELEMEDLEQSLKGIVPISKTDKEAITAFQTWMKDRATSVSAKPETVKMAASTKSGRAIRS